VAVDETAEAGGERAVRHRDRPIVRHRDDLVLAAVSLAILLLLAVPIHHDSVSAFETQVFKAVNSRTLMPFVVVWVGMQVGNLFVIPIVAAVGALTHRPRLGASLLVAGVSVYVGAKWVKRIIKRGRPAALLGDVVIRGATAGGLGFVSGHAAVATALALVAWPWVDKRGKVLVVIGAAFVAFARVYVGAHLPLDILGGAALGACAAGIVRFAFGRPTRTPSSKAA
jgi:undecaprenyl-diphosphatase